MVPALLYAVRPAEYVETRGSRASRPSAAEGRDVDGRVLMPISAIRELETASPATVSLPEDHGPAADVAARRARPRPLGHAGANEGADVALTGRAPLVISPPLRAIEA